MSSTIHTVDGPGVILEISRSHGNTQYRIAGDGFAGWYASHEILSDVDDGVTTDINFKNDSDEDASIIIPDDDPNARDGVTLPWNPEPVEEWGLGNDGELTQEPNGGDVDLTPTNSIKEFDNPDEDFVVKVYASINWHDETSGETHHGYPVNVNFDNDRMSYDISDHDGNSLAHDESGYSNNPGGGRYFEPSEQDKQHIRGAAEEASEDLNGGIHRHAGLRPRPVFANYVRLIESDSLVRQAAWADVRAKASRLFRDGSVRVEFNSPRECFATVEGDNGVYSTQVHRKNAFGQGVTWWDCDCEWGKHAYLRQRSFVGRMCSHAFATYYAMQARTPAERKDVQRINDTTERHSLASVQGGLMVWDDDLQKVMKQMFNQPGGTPGQPAMPGGGAGLPGAPDLGSDTSGNPMSADPMGADPALAGDPNGAGVDPSGGLPSFVRQNTGPTAPDPTGNVVTSSYPERRVIRHQFSEFTDGNPDDNFEEWPEANSEDADTFNDVQDLDEDNDPEADYYDHFWGRSSASDRAMGPDMSNGNAVGPAANASGVANGDTSLANPTDGTTGDTSLADPSMMGAGINTGFGSSPAIGAGGTSPTMQPMDQSMVPGAGQRPVQNQFSASHTASNDGIDRPDWLKEGGFGRGSASIESYAPESILLAQAGIDVSNDYAAEADDGNDANWTTRTAKTEADIDALFDDNSGDAERNIKEAENFNDDSDEIVRAFQRSAGAELVRTAGRNFTYSEQQDLIDEPGVASQLNNLNLQDSFYAE
jgi:hypothetical protein